MLKKIVAFLIVLLPVAGFFAAGRLIRVENIDCASQFGPCNSDIVEILNEKEGQRLSQSRTDVNKVLEEYTLIKKHSVQFQLPNTLKVEVVERKPKFALVNLAEQGSVLSDEDGVVVSKEDELSSLPKVIINRELPNVGERVGDKNLFALEIVRGVNLSYQVDKGRIVGDTLEVELSDGRLALFPLEGDEEIFLGSLNLILSRLNTIDQNSKIETTRKVEEIDLRYENPVLR